MAILFHCEHCKKEIKAPDEAAGKTGKCPYCQQSSRIPDPTRDDEIPLAPLNDEEERRLAEETRRLREQERMLLEQTGQAVAPTPVDEKDVVTPEDLHHHVVNYCLDMAESKFEQADVSAKKLRRHGYAGLQAIEDFMRGKAHEPALDIIPPRVLQGFLDDLRKKVR